MNPALREEGGKRRRGIETFSFHPIQPLYDIPQLRYLKEVTADETTLRFWQEIYDDSQKLVEIHEEFPVDRGHQRV
jgi:hypothetical protein